MKKIKFSFLAGFAVLFFIVSCSGGFNGTSGFRITTYSLPNGNINDLYSATLNAIDGITPFTWNIISGSLPTGLNINSSSGEITGTPTDAGKSNFTVQVEDSESRTATKLFAITITNNSNGSGGAYPGYQSRIVNVAGLGNQTYYLHIPNSYKPSNATAILYAFHGAAGAGNADQSAQWTRDWWKPVADVGNFILVAQVATGANGSWVIPNVIDVLNEIIDDVDGAYNINMNRRYGWGFSAGGHLMHLLGLANSTFFAAYGISAGCIDGLASGLGWTPADAVRKIPVDIHIGDSDPNLPWCRDDRDEFIAAGWVLNTDLFYTEFVGGHTYTQQNLEEIWYNIGRFSLP